MEEILVERLTLPTMAVFPEKALFAMAVTGRPLMVAGISPPLKVVLPVMVIAPLLVVKVNCACATAGSNSTAPANQTQI